MTAAPPVETPSLGQLAARHLPLLALGFGLAALLLAGTATGPRTVRSTTVELRTLAIVYPLVVLPLLVLIRRRAPQFAGLLIAFFVIAFLVRVASLLAITSYALTLRPELHGTWYEDAWWYSALGRAYAYAATGRDYHLREVLTNYQAVSRVHGIGHQGALPSFVMGSAGLMILTGFSMVGYMLPWTLLGAFWTVQLFVFLRRVADPRVARLVLVYVTFAPDYVLQSTAASKDLAMGILLIWVVDLATQGRFTVWRLPRLVGLAFLVMLVRPALVAYAVPIVIYLVARQRLGEPWRRRADLAVVLLIGAAGSFRPTLAGGVTDSYLIAWIGNLLLVPMPYWLGNALPGDLTMRVVAFQAFVWPLVSSLLLVGAVLQRRGRRVLAPEAWLVLLTYHSLYTALSYMTMTVVRWRLAVAPWLLAAAVSAALAARAEPPAVRRRLALAAGLMLLGLLALNLMLGGSRFLRG